MRLGWPHLRLKDLLIGMGAARSKYTNDIKIHHELTKTEPFYLP